MTYSKHTDIKTLVECWHDFHMTAFSCSFLPRTMPCCRNMRYSEMLVSGVLYELLNLLTWTLKLKVRGNATHRCPAF